MYTLAIDGIDDALDYEISAKVQAFGLSSPETVKKILTDVLLSDKINERRKMFASFCGIWTEKDAAEFKNAVSDLETVNPGDWE